MRLEASAKDVARAAMKDLELGIDVSGVRERAFHLDVALLLSRAGESLDGAHDGARTHEVLRERLAREQREQAVDLERREVVVHVVGVPRSEQQRSAREGHRIAARAGRIDDVVEQPDRARACESARSAQEDARDDEALGRRGLREVHALRFLDRGAERLWRPSEPRGVADPAGADVAFRTLALGCRERVRERRGCLRIAGDVEAARIRVEPAHRTNALDLRAREIRRAHAEAGARHVLARREERFPDRTVGGLHGLPEQREVTDRAEVSNGDGAAHSAEDRAPTELVARGIRREAPPHLQTGARPGSALEPLRRSHRDVRGQTHEKDLTRRTS